MALSLNFDRNKDDMISEQRIYFMIEIATSLNPQVEQMISTFLSYAPDLTNILRLCDIKSL
ncbi:hypothetical protein T01_4003 [Trichinella spiralis]|uniref:Uncharacterized protein n=1 Tax=Trichinella spiralis TaxID=6334 RepID=A0A0V1BCS2_TRISP|nr:hypothetical protein T01_4003 [Trichinella spiralis]